MVMSWGDAAIPQHSLTILSSSMLTIIPNVIISRIKTALTLTLLV
jgi:hypothetical protein